MLATSAHVFALPGRRAGPAGGSPARTGALSVFCPPPAHTMGRMAPETTKTERIGIRALQVNALAIVRRVALGRRITVTDGGRPVAQLVPLGGPRPSPAPADPAAPPAPGAES